MDSQNNLWLRELYTAKTTTNTAKERSPPSIHSWTPDREKICRSMEYIDKHPSPIIYYYFYSLLYILILLSDIIYCYLYYILYIVTSIPYYILLHIFQMIYCYFNQVLFIVSYIIYYTVYCYFYHILYITSILYRILLLPSHYILLLPFHINVT